MDYALEQQWIYVYNSTKKSFNPCFSGLCFGTDGAKSFGGATELF